VAEFLREEWWSSWLWWSGGISSLSPLASLVAISSSLSSNTSLDKFNISGEIHWSTELMSWDQFFTIGPVAASSCGAKSSSV